MSAILCAVGILRIKYSSTASLPGNHYAVQLNCVTAVVARIDRSELFKGGHSSTVTPRAIRVTYAALWTAVSIKALYFLTQ